jgi:hypothetical protein
VLVTNNGQDAELLRNDGGNRGNALMVRLRGAAPNTQAIGARIRLTAGSRTQMRDVKAGSSYLSQNDLRAHFGLGAAARADRIDVRWPSGRTEAIIGVAANQIITIEEGRGIVAAQAFSQKR